MFWRDAIRHTYMHAYDEVHVWMTVMNDWTNFAKWIEVWTKERNDWMSQWVNELMKCNDMKLSQYSIPKQTHYSSLSSWFDAMWHGVGELWSGRGACFGTGFGNIENSCMTVGEPCQGSGELFFGAGFRNTRISCITVGGGTWNGSGGTFFGLDSDTLSKSILTVGEPESDRGNLFFPYSVI